MPRSSGPGRAPHLITAPGTATLSHRIVEPEAALPLYLYQYSLNSLHSIAMLSRAARPALRAGAAGSVRYVDRFGYSVVSRCIDIQY